MTTPLAVAPTHRPKQIAYLGTPQAAVLPLQELVRAGFEVVHVVTRADKRRGRGGASAPSPVKAAAVELGLAVSHSVDDLLGTDVELAVVVAFGQLVKRHVLEVVPMVNLHFSLLPRWRGAAPVERALLAGDTTTGVCLMRVDEGLDTGDVFGCSPVAIGPRVTAEALRGQLVEAGTRLLIDSLAAGLGPAEPQHGEATYAAKIDLAELRLDWERPAAELDRVVRVGGAWTTFRGRRLKVLEAEPTEPAEPAPSVDVAAGVLAGDVVGTGGQAAADGLRLLRVQPEGKAPMTFAAWANGARPQPGEALGGG